MRLLSLLTLGVGLLASPPVPPQALYGRPLRVEVPALWVTPHGFVQALYPLPTGLLKFALLGLRVNRDDLGLTAQGPCFFAHSTPLCIRRILYNIYKNIL